MSEPVPTYGALPYYQFHFVVSGGRGIPAERLLARTRKRVRGVIHRRITELYWEGSELAGRLNADSELKSLLTTVLLEEDDIHVDPAGSNVRIYSNWRPEYKAEMSREALEAYDRIAGHVRQYIAEVAG